MVEGIIIEGCIYGIMALGVFITFRILDFPDLTVDGTFPLGAAIMAAFLTRNCNLWFALSIAFAGGFTAGMLTAVLHNELKIPNLLAGILTMILLYSINLRILGTSNVSLLNVKTILSDVYRFLNLRFGFTREISYMLLFILIILIIKLLLDLFFRTDLGLTIGALGNNQQMIVSQGVNPKIIKIIGVGLSNSLVAVSGAFAAQYQNFADIGLGQGIIIAGLASVMIGEFLIRSNNIFWLTLNVIMGSIIFTAVMYGARILIFDIPFLEASDLKFVQVSLVVGCLAAILFREYYRKKRRRSE
ncbi:MAG: ABC transporter permease [Spirochaetales bacterium]|nr:ABC transporter permease [Spirochaetales bacterium]